ncbi:MAG: TonB-dependent receptor [Burkholderiaceae bacterium]
MSSLPWRRAAVAAACGLACLSDAYADELVAQVVITANRAPRAAADVVADVTVIDADTIERSAATSLPELLQRHAGVEIGGTGGAGQPAAVFLRGTNANHVVVLVDGVRINSATTGTNALEHLPLSQIERIEILRGPASSLYGADAVGGVIQIFTKSGRGTQLRASVGSDRLLDAAASSGGKAGATEWSVQAGAQSVRAFSATNAASAFSFNDDRDPYRNAHAGAKLRHAWADGHSVGAQLLASDAVTHFDAGPGSDDLNRQRVTSLALDSRNRLAAGWNSTLRLARGSDHLDTEGAFPSRFTTDQDQLTWQHDVRALGADWVGGVEWRRERVGGDTAYSQTSRRIASLFGGGSSKLGAHTVEGSLRLDRNSQFGSRRTGRAGYALDLTPAWRVAASAGTAFHAPSFNDLYFPLSYGFSGNPNLKPERANGGDLALRYGQGATAASLTLFTQRIRDLIAVDPTSTTVINVNRAQIDGATLAGSLAWAGWRVSGELTHQDARDADTGARLVRRARVHGRAGAAFTAGAWEAGLDAAGAGARYDSAANTPASRMGGYVLLDAFARWTLQGGLALSGRVRNALDKRYQLAQGYNTAPRQFVLSVEYTAP